MKKLFFVLGVAVLFLMPSLVFAQASRVNVHMYSIQSVADDSSGSNAWLIVKDDIDTSETIDIAIYKNIGAMFGFGGAGALGGDSLALSIFADVSWNDTLWTLADSVQAGGTSPLTFANVVAMSGTDSTCYHTLSLPAAPYLRFRIKAWDAKTDETGGISIDVRVMKQQ